MLQNHNKKLYEGGCHCRAVRFTAEVPDHVIVWVCNCTICNMRKNEHFIVPEASVKNISGSENITIYTFGTHTAKHMFCKICGVTPFYKPRSNPDGYAITLTCLDAMPPHVEKKEYNGLEWEKSYTETNIKEQSKPAQ